MDTDKYKIFVYGTLKKVAIDYDNDKDPTFATINEIGKEFTTVTDYLT